jgi:hypothetical protein
MAQKISVALTDDLDGTEATETVRFSIDGNSYEIDLNAMNAAHMRDVIGRYTGAARRVGGNKPRSASSDIGRKRPADPENAKIRDWAISRGIKVGTHGRIPEHIRAMYESTD